MPEVNIENALKIEGWMTPAELNWLAARASEHHTIIEIGCFIGRSTRALVDNTSGIVYAVDIWSNSWHEEMKDSDPDAYHQIVVKYPEYWKNFVNNLHDKPSQVEMFTHYPIEVRPDMIFIDGSHLYNQIISDINISRIKIRQGGLISGHDYNNRFWPDVTRAVNESFKVVHNPVDSIWVGEL